jgi:hypothetical protein
VKEYQEVDIPAKKEKRCVGRSCDLCGKKGGSDKWDSVGWTYDINETEIEITCRQKEGSSYPEGGSGTEYQIDLCPDCFKDKLIPWLRSQGAKIEDMNWDW